MAELRFLFSCVPLLWHCCGTAVALLQFEENVFIASIVGLSVVSVLFMLQRAPAVADRRPKVCASVLCLLCPGQRGYYRCLCLLSG
jgi:hypothetical protein